MRLVVRVGGLLYESVGNLKFIFVEAIEIMCYNNHKSPFLTGGENK